jgi:hypothetical protein
MLELVLLYGTVLVVMLAHAVVTYKTATREQRCRRATLLRLQRLGIQGLTAIEAYADITIRPPTDPADEQSQLNLAAELFRDRASA